MSPRSQRATARPSGSLIERVRPISCGATARRTAFRPSKNRSRPEVLSTLKPPASDQAWIEGFQQAFAVTRSGQVGVGDLRTFDLAVDLDVVGHKAHRTVDHDRQAQAEGEQENEEIDQHKA